MTTAHRTGAREQARTRHGSRQRGTQPVLTAALASLALTGLASTSGPADAAPLAGHTGTAGAGHASPGWARLVDRVPTPDLRWTTCRKTAQCATAELPLNYHDPHGAKITVAHWSARWHVTQCRTGVGTRSARRAQPPLARPPPAVPVPV